MFDGLSNDQMHALEMAQLAGLLDLRDQRIAELEAELKSALWHGDQLTQTFGVNWAAYEGHKAELYNIAFQHGWHLSSVSSYLLTVWGITAEQYFELENVKPTTPPAASE